MVSLEKMSGFCAAVALWLAVSGIVLSAPHAAEPSVTDLPPASTERVDFMRDIQPIFASRCTSCHGPEKQKNGLRLDEKAAALAGGESGPIFEVGNSAASRLIQRVAGLDADSVMPPKGERLTAAQVGLLRAWIDQGGAWPDTAQAKPPATLPENRLWCLQPLTKGPLPVVQDRSWGRNAIDRFVLAALEQRGLHPALEVDRPTLLRRVTFDLVGLPPTPDELSAFLEDTHPEAYERAVERLLASPQYGERWGRHWLDLARYTESQGFEYDHMRANAWHYRDYVIASFNRDLPYNQFVREQIAGDVLTPLTTEGMVATSLLVCGPWDQAGSSQANLTERRVTREEELEDLVSVVCQTFLGLTVNCARCHAHKFDPIPQEDYYRVKSVFEGVRHGEREIATAEMKARAEREASRLRAEIAGAEERAALLESRAWQESLGGLSGEAKDEWAQCQEEIERDRHRLKETVSFPLSYTGVRQQPEPTHRLKRGNVRTPLEEVRPGALSAITELDSDFRLAPDAPEAERRRRFAQWLTDERNPLTGRVIANRVWQYHFGQGLVATPNDFGASGSGVSHPELLDWLADRLMTEQWSLKALHRLVVCSAAYRQAATFDEQAARQDAENRLLWRFTPRRLEAESVRDAMLYVSGQINLTQHGPSFRPFDTETFNATFYLPKDKLGPEFNRRTVYRMNVNSGKDPMLDALDCPDPSVKAPRRGVTTTPLQALSLMNNSFVQRQADALADRVSRETEGDLRGAIVQAYLRSFGREPSARELSRALPVAEETGLRNVCWALLNATEFLYVR